MPAEKSHMFLKKLITVPYLILPFASRNVTQPEDIQIKFPVEYYIYLSYKSIVGS